MVIPFLHETDDISQKIQLYLAAREAAGHDPGSTRVLAAYHLYVGEDEAEARRSAERGMMEYIAASAAAHALTPGMEEPESYRSHLAFRGAIRALTFDQMLDRNRVVVGDARHVREQIHYLKDRLCLTDLLGIFAMGGLSDALVRASMRRFMHEVAPAFA